MARMCIEDRSRAVVELKAQISILEVNYTARFMSLGNSLTAIRGKRDNGHDDQQQCQGTRSDGENSRPQPHRTVV